MLRTRDTDHLETASEGGTRTLFRLGQFRFLDAIGGDEDVMTHFVVQEADGESGGAVYEVDRETMYEFMARYLAGQYELEEYDLEDSPAHATLLDILEIGTARARAGEADFSWDDIDRGETEVIGKPE